MQERVRICDIAEELGLSTATVSNVIHGKTDKVSDATVQRVTALLEVRRSFFRNLLLGLGVAALFTAVCALLPGPVMRVYTKDAPTWQAAASYLALLSGTFLPLAGSTLLSTAFRCAEKPGLPLYAGIASAVLNTGLNDLLIFGRLGLPAMGAAGAAIATVAAQCVNFLLLLLASGQLTFLRVKKAPRGAERLHWSGFLSVLLPLVRL